MKAMLSILLVWFTFFSFKSGVEGLWVAKMQGPNGEMELIFDFKMDNNKLTGVVKGPMGEMPISNTKIDDKEFSFDVDANGMTIKHICTLKDDDSIDMKISGTPMGDTEVIAKRKK